MKKIIIVIVSVIVLIVVIFIINGNFFTDNNNPNEEVKTEEETEKDLSILEMIMGEGNTQRTFLKGVDGSDSFGTASRLVKNGILYHAVIASMPDLQDGNKYEGWLVRPSPFNFFSTGIMKKNEEGFWLLEYTTNKDFQGHHRVVITEETVVDATPETHIIEGDF